MISSYILGLGDWLWFIVALVLFLFELLLPGFFLIWFGVAALIVGLVSWVVPIAWQFQIMLMGVTVLALLFIAKRYRKDLLPDSQQERRLHRRGTQYLGKVYVLDKDTRNRIGRIHIGDGSWKVQTDEDYPADTRVRLEEIKGNTFIAKKAD